MIILDSDFVPMSKQTIEEGSPSFQADPHIVKNYLDSIRKKIDRAKRWMSDELPVVEGVLSKLESMLEKKGPERENETADGDKNSCQAEFDWETIQIE